MKSFSILFCAYLLLMVAGPVGASAASAASAAGVVPGDPSAWWIGLPLLVAVVVIGVIAWRRNRSRTTLLIGAIAAVLVLGITLARVRFAPAPMDMASMQSLSGGAPIPVTTAIVGGASSGASLDVPASVAPFLQQDIVARSTGLLTRLSAYVGDRLHAGDVVAYLDEPELQSDAAAASAQARAASESARSTSSAATAAQADVAAKAAQAHYWDTEIARERYLFSQGAVSEQEYQNERAQADSARNAYTAARASAAGASAQVSAANAEVGAAQAMAGAKSALAGYAFVVVPNDAIVVKRLIDPGVVVTAGTPILRVAVVDRLRVQAQVAQADLASISVGTPLDVRFDDGRVVRAGVTSISPVLDAATRTAIVEAIVSNAGGHYQPGGFARVVLHPARMATDALSLPSSALIGGAAPAVWIEREGTAHRIPVTVVSDDGQSASVRGALRPGMHVVTTGAANLEEGDPIAEASP